MMINALKRIVLAVFATAVVVCFAPLGQIMPPAAAANLLFTNNASTTLASAITNTSTSLTVAASTGSKFPHPTGSQYFRATIVKNGTPSQFEVVKVVAGGSGDTFTIQRAQEGTTAQAWSVGDYFNIFITAADMADLLQADDLQIQSGNYAVDSGTINAYVVSLAPALTQHQVGMPIRVKIANTNTGASTLNPGPGPIAIVTPDNQALQPGNLQGGGIATFIYDGSHYQLVTPFKPIFSQIGGQIGTAQVPLSAVAQYAPVIFTNASLTGIPTAPTASPGNSSTQIANTAFVASAISGGVGSTGGSNPWWEQRPTGIIEQWGTYTYTTHTGAHLISFGRTFPAEVETVVITHAASNIGWDTWIQAGTVNASNFQINDDSPNFNTVTIEWRAIGR